MRYGIPVMKPQLPKFTSVSKYLERMDQNRIYSNSGPLQQQLTHEYSKIFGVSTDQIVLCANATLAIQGVSFLMPVESFVAPSFTFPASISGILNAGKPVTLEDIHPRDWRVDSSQLNASNEQGLIDVLPFGSPVDVHKNPNWNYVIIDAAASLGSTSIELSLLPENRVVVFSLHATKVLGIGEGGIAVFGSGDLANRFRAWINFGFLGSRDAILPGINAKMSEVTSAYGLAVLEQREVEIAEWRAANQFAKGINLKLGIGNITNDFDGVSPYWIVQFENALMRNKVEEKMLQLEIGTRRWWSLGCHTMPAFKLSASGKAFPVTDQIAGTTLGLPMFRDMRPEQFHIISETLAGIL
jgi:dTDP-4-amino-4,6-dideoxygalactose transaminase